MEFQELEVGPQNQIKKGRQGGRIGIKKGGFPYVNLVELL